MSHKPRENTLQKMHKSIIRNFSNIHYLALIECIFALIVFIFGINLTWRGANISFLRSPNAIDYMNWLWIHRHEFYEAINRLISVPHIGFIFSQFCLGLVYILIGFCLAITGLEGISKTRKSIFKGSI